jgi:hypothetical protein
MAHSFSYPGGTGGYSLKVKGPERETNAEVKNAWNFTSTFDRHLRRVALTQSNNFTITIIAMILMITIIIAFLGW